MQSGAIGLFLPYKGILKTGGIAVIPFQEPAMHPAVSMGPSLQREVLCGLYIGHGSILTQVISITQKARISAK
jgi:hypothetical protein